ncbi:MmgE/PrpD family protein [Microvirga antarctica]|uniref:MmgE/PrpD family protein n=1 Tax=Microvirga antarctica TaxID=2819233 RepID=UPI001B311FBD|nr:MmgE/PrpD family protein [Microvirga antarctica]
MAASWMQMPVILREFDATPTRAFAAAATQSHWRAIPAGVRHDVVRTTVNAIGCMLGGVDHPAVNQIEEFTRSISGAPVATVLGTSISRDAPRAALLNALSGSVYAFDDTHAHSIVHPGTPVVAAALAASETARGAIPGETFLNAVAWGLEIACRVSRLVSPGMPMAISQTGTAGMLGAAVAAGVTLGLSAQQLGWAIGIAASSAAGIRAGHGTISMHLLPARASMLGVESALLAQAGFEGGDESLAGPHGFFAGFGGTASTDGLLDGLGTTFELSANTFKPYPCGIVIHPIIDACLALNPRFSARTSPIRTLRLIVSPQAAALADRQHPVSDLAVQVSLQHWAAAALVFGRAGIDEARMLAGENKELIRDLRDRSLIVVDPVCAIDAASVEICFDDGTSEVVVVSHCRGSLDLPMTDAELNEKFVAQATRTVGAAQARRAASQSWALSNVRFVATFIRELAI